jgi:hypothetical protein
VGEVIFMGVGMVESKGTDFSGASNINESERIKREDETDRV